MAGIPQKLIQNTSKTILSKMIPQLTKPQAKDQHVITESQVPRNIFNRKNNKNKATLYQESSIFIFQ
jgi:hypothetical protein